MGTWVQAVDRSVISPGKKTYPNALEVVFGAALGQMGEVLGLAAGPRSSEGKRREQLGTG